MSQLDKTPSPQSTRCSNMPGSTSVLRTAVPSPMGGRYSTLHWPGQGQAWSTIHYWGSGRCQNISSPSLPPPLPLWIPLGWQWIFNHVRTELQTVPISSSFYFCISQSQHSQHTDCVPFLHYIVLPYLNRYVPNMLHRIGTGSALIFFQELAGIVIVLFSWEDYNTCQAVNKCYKKGSVLSAPATIANCNYSNFDTLYSQ